MDILTIGECMAELAPTDAPAQYKLGFAGDTYNTAWYLAQIAPEAHVGFFSAVGNDAISQQMTEAMAASGVDGRFVRALEGETAGLYLISLSDGERSFSYWRSNSAARKLADDAALLKQALDQASIVFFSGITLAILAPEKRASFLAAMADARRKGKLIAFDPNLRPRLWQNPDTMTQAIMLGAAVCDVALPSFEDEAAWFNDANPEATAQRYADAGATTVIVKNGDGPVSYSSEIGHGSVAVEPVLTIVDTTAAGDSFNAAILAGLHANQDIQASIGRASRLAAQVIQSKGALVPVNHQPGE
ncbi:MAG: sugar kinase [Ahrensia sp.]